MTKTRIIGITATLAILALAGLARSDDDHEREHDSDWYPSHDRIAPVRDETYRAECGACHLAYPPALLPRGAWERVMDSLADHFGDDASLDTATSDRIRAYLRANAADVSAGLRAHGFAASPTQGDSPPRITRTRYFMSQHDEVPPRLVAENPEVKSFSACQACHREAERGRFDEDGVRIPGFGRWDD